MLPDTILMSDGSRSTVPPLPAVAAPLTPRVWPESSMKPPAPLPAASMLEVAVSSVCPLPRMMMVPPAVLPLSAAALASSRPLFTSSPPVAAR